MSFHLSFLKSRFVQKSISLALFSLSAFLILSFYSYNADDPSFSTANSQIVDPFIHNLMGWPGALLSDVMLQYIGFASYLFVILILTWSWQLWVADFEDWHFKDFTKRRLISFLFAFLFLSSAFYPWKSSLLPDNLSNGGMIGSVLFEEMVFQVNKIKTDPNLLLMQMIVLFIGFSLFIHASALTYKQWGNMILIWMNKIGILATHLFRFKSQVTDRVSSATGVLKEVMPQFKSSILTPQDEERSSYPERSMPYFEPISQGRKPLMAERPMEPAPPQARAKSIPVEQAPKAKAAPPVQTSFHFDDQVSSEYELPPLSLLQEAPIRHNKEGMLSEAELQDKARELEKVLYDFSIQGQIKKVSPGPVITLYEFEPAPGTKSSRIISLSDDIARTMGATSVRISVVAGENALGIELPNQTRETVYMRQMMESHEYRQSHQKLGLVLGKNISGQPIIADLAKMPHLLIAGTTGSGKSVGINTMILSLLFRHPPEKCRFIMIDPKMLELSVYDGIPHLLSPVVTDPKKAIMALKWAVREMEDRYRAMSRVGVRNIEGYNERLRLARERNEILTNRIQTGFDPDTGKPIFEEQPISLNELPYIVVIVDEMADLMLVAGKEIEATIQRLAQMARAAGIHIITATQRPSVDVITGTIKANFPTRISFYVTSKIDSRTILGEQGAEQLLGQGDMLYTPGGGRLIRVHGPFVSDREVEEVVKFLKAQGSPQYEDAVTEEPDNAMSGAGNSGGSSFSDAIFAGFDNSNDDNALYQQAIAIVKREKKASTSFVQRHLRIGYNRAASLIDKMEADGVISSANHVGKREVLISD
ncbi:MAG: DNA translocase FtsK 4TM domain-containing protein [Alphaproteobacteria bacterium]|jgi:DNA segregation ATPase FtsK/SpoIIIE-like protein|nr:DNA translocase FtsK 4TM domain-containing protein [Alphaproteobacteria bacterium]MBP9876776.1 DNA translocase FtsK 4TM domain-containing protein [Alphaproteobacteria bacterium]